MKEKLDDSHRGRTACPNCDLLRAKRHLYHLLLNRDGGGSESNLTGVEIEIMYQLSLDHQIQEYLSNNR